MGEEGREEGREGEGGWEGVVGREGGWEEGREGEGGGKGRREGRQGGRGRRGGRKRGRERNLFIILKPYPSLERKLAKAIEAVSAISKVYVVSYEYF